MYKLTIDKLPAYILGGRANFIVRDINIDVHIEYKIKRDKNNGRIYHISYKSIDWVYIGVLELWIIEGKTLVKFVAKNVIRITDDMIDKAIIIRKLILNIFYLSRLPNNIEIIYTGVCSVCNRKLTDPKYIEIGIGKICLENKEY